jgi:hypothetical protein
VIPLAGWSSSGGANDEIFPKEAVRQILADHSDAEYHALPTGHFALDDRAPEL